jgi:hypothetical protein
MLKEKVVNKLKNKVVNRGFAKRVTGPMFLAKDLPTWLNYTPSETLVVIATDGDDVKQIVEISLNDFTFDATKEFIIESYAYIFCLFTSKPSAYTELSNELFNLPVHVREVMWIKNNRWASYICKDTSCCPKKGNLIK